MKRKQRFQWKSKEKLEISIEKCRERRGFNGKVKRKQRFQWKSKEKVEVSMGK